MLHRLMTVLGVLLLGALAAAAVFVLGMRAKVPFVVDTQRRVNRALINPGVRRVAGTPGADASLLRHTGRTSGRVYETPVGAVPTEDGFVIALVYGTRSDWLRNVLASGTATIVHEGGSVEVDRPEVLPIEAAAAYFTDEGRRGQRVFGVAECLRVRRIGSPAVQR